MRATLEYVRRAVTRFSSSVFMGRLPVPPLRIKDTASSMGQFVVNARPYQSGKRDISRCYIQISNRHDLPERELEDIILHEMIHYSIWFSGIQDSGPHGPVFREMMERINRTYGRNIAIRHRLSEESRESDCKIKHHFLLHILWKDGKEGFTQIARSRIFDINNLIIKTGEVRELRWYYSTDPYFNRFPNFQTAKYVAMTDEIRLRLDLSLRCECKEGRFGPK